jgi:hypothetical protein
MNALGFNSFFLLSLTLGLTAEGVRAGDFLKQPGESDTAFIARNPPPPRPVKLKVKSMDPDTIRYGAPVLAHGPIFTKWNGTPVALAFYEDSVFRATVNPAFTDYSRETEIEGQVWVPAGRPDAYRRYALRNIRPDGGEPYIESVFFANADRDAKKELAVLVSFDQDTHPDYSGKFYSVFFYDDLTAAVGDSLLFLSDVTDKVGESFDATWQDGRAVGKSLYSTAADVKKRLKKLGY